VWLAAALANVWIDLAEGVAEETKGSADLWWRS
jgi:uncharacterized RmlC-like cupin family protein